MEVKEEQDTILHCIFINNENARLHQYFKKIKFEIAGISFDLSDKEEDPINSKENNSYKYFSKSNDIKINIQLDENRIYYNEIINFFYLSDSSLPDITLDYPIYKGKINNIYIDEGNNVELHEKKTISLEIIYQTIKEELLPKKVIYKGKELTCFDKFNNKFRQRIGLANVDPEKFDFMKDIKTRYPLFQFQNASAYQILVRIPIEGDIEYSIANCDLNNQGLKRQKLKKKENKATLIYLLENFQEKFNSNFVNNSFEQIEDVKKKITELYDEFKWLEIEKKDYYDKVFDYTNFEDIDVQIFILMFYYLEFKEIIKLNENKEKAVKIIDMLDLLSVFNQGYEKYISEIKTLNLAIRDKLLLIIAYNKKFLDSYLSGYVIDFITIINVDKENKSNPYIKSLNFIKDIILNLKEDSRLFEVFLYLDSEVIQNLLINNTERKNETIIDIYGEKKIIEYGKNPTEYGINMINVDEIRNHLLNLIPKYIIRIDTRMKFNANYDPNSKIMFLNERQLFNTSSKGLNKTFQKEKISDKYIMPITIEILHELFGHGKKRLTNEASNSPEDYRDSKHNYKRISIKKKISDFQNIIFPESGVVVENYISEDRKVLHWLKRIHPFEEVKDLLDASLWVDKDFNNLEKKVSNYMEKDENYKENYSQFSYTFNEDDNLNEYCDDTCGFHKFEKNY